MPSSQHQQISKIIDLVMIMNPKSILEVGIGFGKYGFLCREYLEYWKGDIDWRLPIKSNWQVTIDGIEAFEAYLNKHQEYIYNKIYVGDAFKLVDQINKKYELTLIIDVLEHFDYQDGISLIKKCLSKSKIY